MSHLNLLQSAVKSDEKTWLLVMHNIGGAAINTNKEETVMKEIGWKRVYELSRAFKKNIKDKIFTYELNKLKIVLATFKKQDNNYPTEFALTVCTNFNEIGDPLENLKFMDFDFVEPII